MSVRVGNIRLAKGAKCMRTSSDCPREWYALLRVSGLLVVARVGGLLCGITLTLILARTIDPDSLGEVTKGFALVMVLAVGTTLNIEAGNLRFLTGYLTEECYQKAAGFVSAGRRFVMGTGFVVLLSTLILWTVSLFAGVALVPDYLILSLVAAPIAGWLRVNSSYALASGHVLSSVIPSTFLRPLLLLTVIALATSAGVRFDAGSVMLVFLLTLIAVAALQTALTRKALGALLTSNEPDHSRFSEWLSVGLHMIIPIMMVEFSTEIIILISSSSLSDEEIAVLGIVLRVVGCIRFGIFAVNRAISPRLSGALRVGDRDEVDQLLWLSGHSKFWPALVCLLLLSIWGTEILGFFGPAYKAGSEALIILAIVPVILAFFGPTTMTMPVLDLQRYSAPVFLGALLGLLFLIPAMGALYGLNGVAAAVTVVWFAWNAAIFFLVLTRRGYDLSLLGAVIRKRRADLLQS